MIGSIKTPALGFALGFLIAMSGPAQAQSLGALVEASKQTEGGNDLLGSTEIRSDSLKGLPQWTRVIGAMKSAGASFNSCAKDASACNTSVLKQWRKIVAAANALPQQDRIKSVHQSFNAWPYKLDMEVWGVREYWATPKEFISRSGDCEDYAIAKYYALRAVGFNKDEVRVVALRDRIRGIGHAVLAVYTGGDIVILDNLSPMVASHTRFKHYQPQVSMNETSRWAHVGSFKPDPNAQPSFATAGLSARTLFRKR